MTTTRDTYAHKAIPQVPRLLTLQDRNRFSPSYGCFDRRYWLDKVADFPTALAQFGVQTLALVYKHDFPGNIYKDQPKIRDWCLAGMDYWTRIQHRDGSLDEFYPFERGWVGPTGFTLYAVVDAAQQLSNEIPPELMERLCDSVYRAARYISRHGESGGILANHHAMGVLAVRRAYEFLGLPELERGFRAKWQAFLRWHTDEGWSLEYDGVDPGYLSATVSFLGKVYQTWPDDGLRQVLESAVEFASYFVYPDGYYAGSTGSRQTLHFYPHGFEVLAPQMPLAGAVAQRLLDGLAEGSLVPPEIQADRYFLYRIPEFLQCYLDTQPRPEDLPSLPYQREPFRRYFAGARVFVAKAPNSYLVANLAKGGVVKAFSIEPPRLVHDDCGIIGTLDDGTVVSSQWIDPGYEVHVEGDLLEVEGNLNKIAAAKYFTPLKTIVFRAALLAVGWNTRLCQLMKGNIRKVLMLGSRPLPIRFRRTIRLDPDGVPGAVIDHVELEGKARFRNLSLGDEFSVRYVPQSRYFQPYELEVTGYDLSAEELQRLHATGEITIVRELDAWTNPKPHPQGAAPIPNPKDIADEV